MKLVKWLLFLVVFILLTVVTQIGGVILVLSVLTTRGLRKKYPIRVNSIVLQVSVFIVIYFAACFVIVPPLARLFGRNRLPISLAHNIQPCTFGTVLCNRNYVGDNLKSALVSVANRLAEKYPGTVVNYLDGSFPFIDGFPLFPHLSHNDGKKLDISFRYRTVNGNQITNKVPSPIGYGVCEGPQKGEPDLPDQCDEKGFWQYSLLQRFIPQSGKSEYVLDQAATAQMVRLFAKEARISKIFIEPHLKQRLNLDIEKVRFHGCQAVRHDDHIHIQSH